MEVQNYAVNVGGLIGQYKKDGNKLISSDLVGYLQIAERQNPTPKKSAKFLVYKTPEKDWYISSMYNLNGQSDCFKIEWKGQLAILKIGQSDATIVPLVSQTTKYINSSL